MGDNMHRTDSDLMEQKIDELQSALDAGIVHKGFLEEPVTHNSNHCSCKSCTPLYNIAKRMKCELCDKDITGDHKHSHHSKQHHPSDTTIVNSKFKILDLYPEIEKTFEKLIRTLKEHLVVVDESIDNQIENAKNHIIQRVESLKAQLDIWCYKLISELDKNKNDLKDITKKIKVENYDKNLDDLRVDIKNIKNLTEERYQNQKLENEKLDKLVENLKNFDRQLTFEPNEEIISTSIIGKINSNYKRLSNRVKNGIYETIDLKLTPLDLCVLPNDRLLVADLQQLAIYDKTFRVIANRSQLNENRIAVISVATNFRDKIYVCDNGNSQILIVDFNLNFVGSIGSHGRNCAQFNDPRGIGYYAGHLYVCDYGNKRIQKFGENLDYKGLVALPYNPLSITLANNLACVRGNCQSVFFYKLSPFSFVCRYDGHNGSLCEIGANFYEFYPKINKIFSYDQNGVQREEIEISFQQESIQFDEFDRLLFFNKNFVLTSNKKNKLIIF